MEREMKLELEKDKLLFLLLITDFAFIILHILNLYTGLLNSSLYMLTRDRGYAEFFQYTKELWITVMFLILGIKKKQGIFYVFSLLFLYLLIDDSFEIHENFGRVIADIFNIQPWMGLRAVDFGELIVSGLFGLLFLTALILFFILSDQISRQIALYMVMFFVLLGFFGVVMDMVAVMVGQRGTTRVLEMIEEGGEMLVMSVITWFVYRTRLKGDQLPLDWLPIKRSIKAKEG
jgi:hypothetical protein